MSETAAGRFRSKSCTPTYWCVLADPCDLRHRLREKSIVIYDGKGCFTDKVCEVGNIGNLSDYDIRFFLAAVKDVLLTFQSEEADLVAPVIQKGATLVMLPTPERMQTKVVS